MRGWHPGNRLLTHPGSARALVFIWSFAEATVWPVMPDAALVPLAAARSAAWWRLVLVATLGTLVGGLVSYLVGRVRPAEALLARLPLVRPAMARQARAWLAAEGAAGLRHQPLSGLPYKVFAVQTGALGLPLGPFLGWTLLARGSRFLGVGATVAALGARFRSPLRRYAGPLLLAWCVVFTLGLRQTVRAWERRGLEGLDT